MNSFERAKQLIAWAIEQELQRTDIDTLAAHSGIDSKMIQQYLDRIGNPTTRTLCKLVDALPITLALMFLDKEDLSADKISQVIEKIHDAQLSISEGRALWDYADKSLAEVLDMLKE